MLIGYARVSKADGSQSLDLQRDALRAAGVDAVHVYHDFASGVRDDRPGLDSCVRALRPGDVLIVWKLDRLGRNLAHLVNTVQDLSARGVGLRVLTGQGAQIDTTTAAGRLVFGIFVALAEFERELIQPILDDHADVVFGSRFIGGEARRVLYFWHAVGNRLLTALSNLCTNIDLTDMETGYKVFRREVLQRITIEEDRFGVEPELTAKVARLDDIRLFEVGISYTGRTYTQGKKIGWRDGLEAAWCILKYTRRERGGGAW